VGQTKSGPEAPLLLTNRSALLFFSACLATLVATAAPPAWELVKQGRGVKVWMQDIAGARLPLIRARTRIAAEPLAVLAVINDVNGSCAWAGRCVVARILRREGVRTRLYSLRSAPWPISDRDFELNAVTRILEGGKRLRVDFREAARPRTPVPDGVVRMPVMRGHYDLRHGPGGSTEVELQVRGDPGGWIPDWIVRWTAKNGPFASLSGLRKRVPKVRGKYSAEVARLRAWLAASVAASHRPATKTAPVKP